MTHAWLASKFARAVVGSRSRLALVAGTLAASLGGIGCGSPAPEGLVVSAQTDFVAVAEFDYVRVSVDTTDTVDHDVSVGDDFARPRPLYAFHGLMEGRRLVTVSLMRGEAPLVSRRVQVDFRGSELVNVVLARSCADIECGSSESCAGGVCVPPSCVDGTEPSCPRPQCTVDETCTSTTSCVAPRCVAGVCLETGDDDVCAANELCVPSIGCISRPPDDDGGIPRHDAGTMDGGAMDGGSVEADDAASGELDATMMSLDAPTAMADAPMITTDAPGCAVAEDCTAGPCESVACVAGRCEAASLCAGGEMCCSGVCAIDCASVSCAGRAAGTECRASTGDCDPAEQCDGSSPMCPDDVLRPSSFVCRAATGTCDVAERCTTGTAECAPDGFAPTGTTCTGGSCDGLGACSTACVPGAACSTGNPCERGTMECSPSARCVSAGAVPASTICRAAVGVCDVEETCGGSTTCPADGFASTSRECRAQRGVCDRAEMCTGTAASCPSDAREPSSTTCRAVATGGCDVAETCSGSSDDCPANAFRSASTVCRSALGGGCDVAESCTGASATCPADALAGASTVCRVSAGACDPAEQCTGASSACPPDVLSSMGTTCRPSAGVCDLAEVCSGSVVTCPGDGFRSAVICRGAFGDPCNEPELCPGDAPACPADEVSPAGTNCDQVRCGGTCNGAGACGGGFDCPPKAPFCAIGCSTCHAVAMVC